MKKSLTLCALLLVLTVCAAVSAVHFHGEYSDKLAIIDANERLAEETAAQAQAASAQVDALDSSEAERYETEAGEMRLETEELRSEIQALSTEKADAAARRDALEEEYAYYGEMYDELSEGMRGVEDALAENS